MLGVDVHAVHFCLPCVMVRVSGGHLFERVEKIDMLLDRNSIRSKIKDFRSALPTLAVPKENIRLEREFSLTAAP